MLHLNQLHSDFICVGFYYYYICSYNFLKNFFPNSVYIYVYVCLCVYIYMFICVYMYMLICVYIHVYVYIYMFICVYTCLYVYIHAYVYICTCVYVYACLCMSICRDYIEGHSFQRAVPHANKCHTPNLHVPRRDPGDDYLSAPPSLSPGHTLTRHHHK